MVKLNILKAICDGVHRNRGRHLVPFIDARVKLGWKWPLYIPITPLHDVEGGKRATVNTFNLTDRIYAKENKGMDVNVFIEASKHGDSWYA